MIEVVVLLKIRDRCAFLQFESQALKIMRKYGGNLVSAFEPDPHFSSAKDIGEIHYLNFPNRVAFDNYRDDSGLKDLSELRHKAIADTQIYVSGAEEKQ